MSSAIEWTDETWNPTVGCSKVSPGCDGCYAIGVAHRAMQPAHEGLTIRRPGERPDWTGDVRILPDRLETPLHWHNPRRVFVDSMSDLFHPDVPNDFVDAVFDVMALAANHTFQVLTKRPKRMSEVVPLLYDIPDDDPLPNVWLGTSIESDRYVWRANHLRDTPAAVRFLSLEPLLGPLPSLDLTGIDWVIVGGESGPNARPMNPWWVRGIRDRCEDAGIPFFFKQWGVWAPWLADDWTEEVGGSTFVKLDGSTSWAAGSSDSECCTNWSTNYEAGDVAVTRVGKKRAGRKLDGRTYDAMPELVS